jgi:hypothetical protein
MHCPYNTYPTDEAYARTHPSRNFHLRHVSARDAAHAKELLSIFCARVCDWGLVTFDAESPEARLLHALRSLYVVVHDKSPHEMLQRGQTTVSVVTDYGTHDYGMQTVSIAVVDLTSEVMRLKDYISGFSLSFEVGSDIYDVIEVTQRLESTALAQLLRVNPHPRPYC